MQSVVAGSGGKTTTTEFVYNANGQRVSVWNGSNTQLRGQYYWGSQPVAFYVPSSSTHFQHQDWLGTERLRTSYNGTVEGSYTSLPCGDDYTPTGSDLDPYHYAQLDYDSESGTDHAQYRQYSSAQGRWMRPDPYSGSYDFSNPQSMNRYAYVLNNPLSATDPSGLNLVMQCDDDGNCYEYDDGNAPIDTPVPPDVDCDASGTVCYNPSQIDPTGPGSPNQTIPNQPSPDQPKPGLPGAPNSGKAETSACRTLRQNAEELTNQVNHPFAWNGPQMTGAKIGFGIGIVGNAIVGCAAGVLLTETISLGTATPLSPGTCTGGAIANSISPGALASDLLATGAGFVVANEQLKTQAQQAQAQYEAACQN